MTFFVASLCVIYSWREEDKGWIDNLEAGKRHLYSSLLSRSSCPYCRTRPALRHRVIGASPRHPRHSSHEALSQARKHHHGSLITWIYIQNVHRTDLIKQDLTPCRVSFPWLSHQAGCPRDQTTGRALHVSSLSAQMFSSFLAFVCLEKPAARG